MPRFWFYVLVLFLAPDGTAQPPTAATTTELPLTIAFQSGQESLVPLVKAVYQELGVAVEFENLPSERALAEANRGRVDGELGRIPGALASYANLIQTRENLVTILLQAWVAPGSSRVLRGTDDLAGLRMGIVIGSKISEQFVAEKRWTVTPVATHEALAKLLVSGRLDVALISTASRDSAVRRIGTLALSKLTSSETFHVLNRTHADLVERFDAVLKAMKRDGRYATFLNSP